MRSHMRTLLVMLIACGSTTAPPSLPPAEIGHGVVAACGSVAIDGALVSRVAGARNITANQATDDLIFDAAFAQGAVARALDRRTDVRAALRTVRARLVADRIAADAAAKGPPTDAEVARSTARHWRDVDIPETARAVHVVVLEDADAAKQKRAPAIAEELRKAVLGATNEVDFIARTKTVDIQGLQIKPEMLPMFAADGRVVEGTGDYDADFTAAAFALAVGDTSGPIKTKFGIHIIRMLERNPAKHLPLEERRTRFTSEILAQRGHEVSAALLADLKKLHPVKLDPAADALMASAVVP